MKTSRNAITQQPALFTSVRWPRARQPRRDAILDTLAAAINWAHLEGLVRPHYQADSRRTGRKGYSLSMMLRAHVLRLFWQMSERQLETAILDSHSMARFIGSDPWQPRPPSAAVLCRFRQMLEATWVDDGTPDQLAAVIERCVHVGLLRNVKLEFRAGVIADPVFRRADSAADSDETSDQ